VRIDYMHYAIILYSIALVVLFLRFRKRGRNYQSERTVGIIYITTRRSHVEPYTLGRKHSYHNGSHVQCDKDKIGDLQT
jgi:hypothetical protein